MIWRVLFPLSLIVLLWSAPPVSAQTAADSVVDVPYAAPSQRSGVVPTNLLPMGALRIESGGVRLPGEPPPPPRIPGGPPGATVAMPFGAPADLVPPGASPPTPPPAPAPAPTHAPGKPTAPARKGAAPAPAQTGCVGGLNAPLQIQLGAVDGRTAADREADRLMRRHGDVLGARPTPTDCSSSHKDLFRLRLAVPTAAEGHRLCNEMAGRGERCILVRGGQ